MRIACLFLFMLVTGGVQASEFWTSLWHNADQRGDALMQQGDAKGAAKIYSDPRRIAYARLKAGDYQGAADVLGKLHDSDADYNRGNALARAGNLQGALNAYDAALTSNPENRDAKHNRELVANAMKPKNPENQKEQSGKADDKAQQGKNSQGSNKQGENGKQDKSSSNSGQAANQPGKEQDSSGHAGKSSGTSETGSRDAAGKNSGEKGRADQGAGAKAAQAQAGQADQAAQAQQAVQARTGQAAAGKTGADEAGKAAPKSEQQLAEDQWLRNIPDDPGGLLRRKFLIEHMLRQQREQQ